MAGVNVPPLKCHISNTFALFSYTMFHMEPVIRKRPGKHGPAIRSWCAHEKCLGRRKCRACRRIWSRENRHRWPPSEAQRQKANCRAFTKEYQKRGALPTGPCEGCGSLYAENHHHWGYEHPKWFIRLCRECHLKLEQTAKAPNR